MNKPKKPHRILQGFLIYPILFMQSLPLQQKGDVLGTWDIQISSVPHSIYSYIKENNSLMSDVKEIPYKQIKIKTDSLYIGTSKVIVKGKNGKIFRDYIDLGKGKRIYLSTKYVKPVDEVIQIGTKVKIIHNCTYWNQYIDDIVDKKKYPEKNSWMRYVMLCESGCNSGKNIERYFKGSKNFYGLYQFTEYTFKQYGGKDLFDGFDQIRVTSRMYDLKGNPEWHWPACNRAFERDYNK